MFAVIEDFEAIEPADCAKTCITHSEIREVAEKEVRESKLIRWNILFEKIEYQIIEFKGRCPNCGRSFFF